MKKITFLFLMVFWFAAVVFSQKTFEGKVVYQVNNADGKEAALIEVLFGKEKIKTNNIVNNYPQNATGDLLIDFSKGLIYHFPFGGKDYNRDCLPLKINGYKSQQFKAKANVLNISGKMCKAFINITADGKKDIDEDKILLHWYADSLFFSVAAAFAITDEISILTNGQNIGLGMGTQSKNGDSSYFNNFIAISINAMIIPDSFFIIPNDYKLLPNSFYKTNKADNKTNYKIEITEITKGYAPPPPPPPLPKTKKKTKKSQSAKLKQ